MRLPTFLAPLALIVPLARAAPDQAALNPETRVRAEQVAQRAITFLKSAQDPATGGWSIPPADSKQPQLPAISALVLNGLLMQPGLENDPAVQKGLTYLLKSQKPDGGIYDAILPSYNTAISISALARAKNPDAQKAIPAAVEFLKRSQWGADLPGGPAGVGGPTGKEAPKPTDRTNPNFGGLGYGNRGRPDLSNLAFAVQAWHDVGVPADDPAFQRAVVFLQRVQMLEKLPDGTVVNDQPYAKGSTQGGFIYAAGETDQSIGQGNSWAGSIEESLSDGTRASRLRAYGSVTYSGFKSYLYAGLKKDDPRVTAAVDWAKRNYTLLENPGLGSDGFYYYLVTFSRAMSALGADELAVQPADLRTTLITPTLPGDTDREALKAAIAAHAKVNTVLPLTPSPDEPAPWLVYFASDAERAKAQKADITFAGSPLKLTDRANFEKPGSRRWREDLLSTLSRLQNPDGSFASIDDRWMENNPVLVTAYGLVALQHALRE